MKKYITSFVLLIAVALSFICFPKYASAEEDLHITDWVVDAYLLENGDLQISEDITFEFKDKFNGVYRDIVMDKTSGVSGIKVQEAANDSFSDYTLAAKAKNGDRAVYTLEEKNNKVIVKIFSPSKNEKKTFRISYIVNNVAVKYNDTGELYYKFLGKDNKTDVENFTVKINLPYEDNGDRVKVFAHGPLNGKIDKTNNKSYELQVRKVPSKTFVEGRLLFPVEFIAASDNVQTIDKYQDIIDEEAAYQTKLEQNRQRREDARRLLNKITVVFSVINIFAFIIVLHQCKRRFNRDILKIEYRDIPEDCTPAVASYMVGMYVNDSTIFATILDLFRKGYLRIGGEDEDLDASENQNFILYKTKNGDMSLLEHERFFMNWLFDDIGDGEAVSTKDIEYHGKHKWQKYYESQSAWRKKIKEEVNKRGYIDHSKRIQGSILTILSIIGFVLGIVTAVFGSLYALLNFACCIILLIYGLSLFSRFSDKGYIQYKKWISFKKYMNKYNPDLPKEEVIDSLDSTLIYALGLNVIQKQKLTHDYDDAYAMNSWVFWYIIFASSNDNSLRRSINNSFAGGSTSSPQSGGFSGGGGGGAGGGGAGGF